MHSTSYKTRTTDVNLQLSRLRADTPDTLKGFSAMAAAAMRDGALDRKTKELIATAIGVAARCDDCIGFHASALVKLGATRAELEEMLGVVIYMGGGPSLMYSAHAMAAFDEFSAEGGAA